MSIMHEQFYQKNVIFIITILIPYSELDSIFIHE